MKNKTPSPRRGRPRSFDEAAVLQHAQMIFLERGFEATAYEEIADATGLSKPSLYNSFGDKSSMFEQALASYANYARSAILESFSNADTLPTAARNMLLAAADVYAPPDKPSTGCLLIGTALPASTQSDAIQKTLSHFITSLDEELECIIREKFSTDAKRAQKSSHHLALHVSSLLFSLAIRARMGIPRRKLRIIAADLAATTE